MTKLQIRAFLYQLGCFAILFIAVRYIVANFTNLTGFWIPITAFMVGTLLSPKFHATKIKGEEKMFIKWIFIKGIKEIK